MTFDKTVLVPINVSYIYHAFMLHSKVIININRFLTTHLET